MNAVIKDIIYRKCDKEDKIKALNKLRDDIDVAMNVLSGEYKYCEVCDDYYLAKSFLCETKNEYETVCTYSDPINSGGNEYGRKLFRNVYAICPKGHKTITTKTPITQ